MLPFFHRLSLSMATGCSHKDCFRNKHPVPDAAAALRGASGESALLLSNPKAPTLSADGMVGSLSRIGGLVVPGNQVLPTAIKIKRPIAVTTNRNLSMSATGLSPIHELANFYYPLIGSKSRKEMHRN
jgi:hypothetical protein